jgi:hypothetical protein
MRRPLVLFTLAAGLVSFTALAGLGVVACGGNDKPPLTPDTQEPLSENPDAAAPSAPSTGTGAPAAPPAK